VIHCTSTEGLDEGYFRAARSLGLLATGYGRVRLLHYVFDATNDEVNHLRLLEVSGELPENPESGKLARRGLSVNDWDITDQWDAIFTCTWSAEAVAWHEAGPAFHSDRAMWIQKMGNTPDQWEDAFALDAPNGVAAVADGASSGIYCRIWADQLCSRFVADRPDTRDPISLNKWINGLRTEWRSAINYSNLNWSKQGKVDSVGAAATFVGLEFGPAEVDGYRPWRACAVGDASLFWVRDGRLLATFPVVAADQFGSAPLLVRSNPGFKTLTLAATGTCAPGDRFVLATDAVASRLFKSVALGPGPEWDWFETTTEEAWRAELDALRRANDMVNDDCTLVVLCVNGLEAGVPKEEAPAFAATSAEDERLERALLDEGDREAEVAGEPATLSGGAEVQEEAPAPAAVGEGVPSEGAAGPVAHDEQPVDAPLAPKDVAITADVGDLMIDLPNEPLQENRGGDTPHSAEQGLPAPSAPKHDEPPPADEPPAARDGFPESTDPRV
jgi:hypothetical protein